jgi:hydrophobic/amphiphilic exporter-1 (mainly G- bacteria), HAE1 family
VKITRLAVRRRLATSAIAVALAVLGLYGLRTIPVDFLPAVTYPMIKVHIWWPGATPEEIDKNIADPIERQMATVDDLDFLESSSIEGMYTLQANFEYGVDVDVAYQDALAAMARVARELPGDIQPPVVIKADPSQLPVVQMTVRSDEWNLVELRAWADEWLQDQLLAVPGVAGTEIVGGLQREIRVHLYPDALEKFDLTLADVLRRLREENVEQFAGRVTAGPREIIARTTGEYRSLEEIRDVVLLREGGSRVRLRDVAEVVDSHRQARVITRLDGEPSVKLSVLKQASANTVEVALAVSRRIEELSPALPPGVSLGLVENQADYVSAALGGVRNAAFEATILVLLIVWLFLGSWRQVVVVAVTIPLTLILNFGLMKLAGFSLNIFSLGGLVIAIGVLVDNSVVVIETITRRHRERIGAALESVVVDSTAEVGPAIVAARLSFIALFIPFLLVPALMSLLFRELILVITGIVVISLLMAVTVTPMLTFVLMREIKRNREESRFERLFARITDSYGRMLSSAIRSRWLVSAIFIAVLLMTVVMARGIGSEFLPQIDDGRIMVKVKLPTGAAIARTDRILQKIEERIAGDPKVESVFTLSGGKVWGLYTYEIANEGEINIQLVPRSQRDVSTAEFIDQLRPIVASVPVPGGSAMVSQMKVKGLRKLGDADVEVKVRGRDVTRLHSMARDVASTMNELEHFRNVHVSMDMTKPEYRVEIDRERAAELGVSVNEVASTLRALIEGTVATRLREREEYYDVRVMIPESAMKGAADVAALPVRSSGGGILRLDDVAAVREATGPVEIAREDQIKQVIVRGDAAGVSVGEALRELKVALSSREVPAGYELQFGGQAAMMQDMRNATLAIFAFAVFFAFTVLAVQFDSLRLPALILGSVPFCMAGLVLALFVTGLPFGATVTIGVLVVIAATVNDGVLLLTLANQIRDTRGVQATEAVIEAATVRLRPRVMTTAAILIGFLPLALAIEEGSDMLQPMAVGAIGGLLMEIVVALFLMPVMYVIFARRAVVPSKVPEASADLLLTPS